MAQVAIIGAGMAGLCTAALTAAAGHDVTVFEAGPRVGGKLNTSSDGGHTFDTGPSVFTFPQVYQQIIAATGHRFDDELPLEPVDPMYDYWFADGTQFRMPAGSIETAAAAVGNALGDAAGDQWLTVLRRGRQIWHATKDTFLQAPMRGLTSLLPLARNMADVRAVGPTETMRAAIGKTVTDPKVAMLVDRYATYAGSDPRHAPAALLSIPYMEQEFGAWYITGGLYRLAEVLADCARARGATIHLDTPVSAVAATASGVTGVRTADGHLHRADVVVSAIDVAQLTASLLPGLAARQAKALVAPKLHKLTPSLSGFVMLLSLRGRTPGLAHHTVMFGADPYDHEFDAVFGTGHWRRRPSPITDPVIYLSAPNDPSNRPDADHESWFVLVNAPRHHSSDRPAGYNWSADGVADQYADRLLRLLAARGLDVTDRLVARQLISPADLEHRTGSVGGSIYGSSSNGPMSVFHRPSNATGIRGLFLTGGSCHPGGGLPLVAMSAQITADLIGKNSS